MLEMTREQRVNRVANGIMLVMQAASDDHSAELTQDDKTAIREMSQGLIKIWEGLNAKEVLDSD
jgi:hypothetical protein